MVDFLDEILDGKDGDDGDKTEVTTGTELADLKGQIEELNKEKAGLLKGVKAERSKRQEITGKLSQLTDTVNGILANRQNAAAQTVNEAAEANRQKGLPVTWTEDGEGFIATDKVDELLNPYKNEILNLKQQLELTNSNVAADSEAEKVRRAIVGEDERYDKLYNKYQAARRWVTDQVSDFAQANNAQRPLQSGEAMDMVFNDADKAAEFETNFPNVSLMDIVTAEDSKSHFRNTLSNMAKATDETVNPLAEPDSRFKKVLNKPSGLGSTANANAGTGSVMDKLERLSALDLIDIDDATAAKLEQMMKDEENSDGVNF